MQRAAAFQLGMTPVCRNLGFAVLDISIAAGTGADLMAGSAGAAGAAPDVLSWLYSTQRAAAIHLGMSPQCRTLGLGVREISIAAGTGADVMAGGPGAAGPAPSLVGWDIPRKTGISQGIQG